VFHGGERDVKEGGMDWMMEWARVLVIVEALEWREAVAVVIETI